MAHGLAPLLPLSRHRSSPRPHSLGGRRKREDYINPQSDDCVRMGHLEREFVAWSQRAGETARIGLALLAAEKHLFTLWYRVRDGTLGWADFHVALLPLIARVRALLQEGVAGAEAKAQGTCRNLLKREAALWTVVWEPGVDPTTNGAAVTAGGPLAAAQFRYPEGGGQSIRRTSPHGCHYLTPTTTGRAGLFDVRLCRRDPQRTCLFALAAHFSTAHVSVAFAPRCAVTWRNSRLVWR